MNNFAKKFTSAGMALLIASAGAFASGASAGVLPKNSYSSGVKKKSACCWNKIPKPIRILGEIGLIGTPLLAVCGVIVALGAKGINKDKQIDLTPTQKATRAQIQIIKKCHEIYGDGVNVSELNKLKIVVLRMVMCNIVALYELPYKDCIYLSTDLLEVNDDNILNEEISKLDRDTVYYLTQIVNATIDTLKVLSTDHNLPDLLREQKDNPALHGVNGVVFGYCVDNFNCLFSARQKLGNKTLVGWLENVKNILLNKLKEMDTKTLKGKNIDIEKTLGCWQSGIVYLRKDQK